MLASILIQIILLLVGTCALYVHWKNRKFHKIFKIRPTNMRRVPLMEHAVNFMGSSEDRMNTFKKMAEETINSGLVSFWLGPKFIVMVGDALDAEFVLKTCLDKDDMVKIGHRLLGNGTIFAPVSIWRPRRKVLAPTFGQKTLNNFVKIFSKQSAILAEQLELAVGNDIPLFEKVATYSMNSVCETVLGVQMKSQSNANNPFVQAFYQFSDIATQRMLNPWLYLDIIYRWHEDYPLFESCAKIMQQFVGKIIKSKRQDIYERQQNNKIPDQENDKTKSLLEVLIVSGGDKGFNDLELQEESIVMILAGTDTSSVAVSFTALMLAKHPDIQEKVYQEIKDEIGVTKSNIEPSDLLKLKYLEAVIKETMRLYPPVPIIIRKVEKDITLPSGVTLVSDLGVMINILAIHKNPKYWGPDSNKFRPERFLEGPLEYPFAFIPFGYTPRSCLGYQYAMMSMKIVMANMLRRYKVLPAKGSAIRSLADDELPVTHTLMLKHRDNFEVQLEPRN
nr:cytochrome P450 monooxygenase CYP341AB1 [Ephestia elutella]